MAKKKHKPDPPGWKIKRKRDGDTHIQACSSGYYKTTKKFKQVHHIVPISSMADGTIKQYVKDNEAFKFIRNCLKETPWDINAAPNCIGLPLKPVYGDKRAPSGWDKLPCHQVDHNPYYTEEVSDDLNTQVWEPSIEVGEECDFKAKSLLSQLKKRSTAWRRKLKSRGSREKGTKYCWNNRMKIPTKWYKPFSMAASPMPRSAPVDWDDFNGSMQKYLQKLFTLI